MIVTSTQTDRQSIYGVCHEWINGAIHGLRGIAAHHKQHIRPHGNFMLSGVLWCLSSSMKTWRWTNRSPCVYQEERPNRRNGSIINHESMMCVFIHYESIINEWWILNRQSSIISPLIAMVKMFAVSLVERWRTAAFSQFCLQIALPYEKRAYTSL